MDELLPLLGVGAPVLLVLLAGLGWIVRGRRRGPSTPSAPPAIATVIEDTHHRQVERAEAEAAEVAADAKRVDTLPPRERNATIGARLRK